MRIPTRAETTTAMKKINSRFRQAKLRHTVNWSPYTRSLIDKMSGKAAVKV